MKLNIFASVAASLLVGGTMVSCSDFLDKEPPSSITPDVYYTNVSQVEAVANKFYEILPDHNNKDAWGYGMYNVDRNTDNQAGIGADNKYAKGLWKVSQNDPNTYNYNNIRDVNYQLNEVWANYYAKKITGTDATVRQYIGELFFFRAYAYFDMLQKYGDLPILKTTFTDKDEEAMNKATERKPRNEVARFILADLDSAQKYLQPGFDARKTRISPDVAHVFASRVALFEGSWLTNFKGTPFVPGGPGWPGAAKDYNKGFKYESGDIDTEAKWFFKKAMDEADAVAKTYASSLKVNNGVVPQSESDNNPYFSLFGNTDMTPYPEVLLWKQYSKSLGIQNNVEVAIQHGDIDGGITRGMVEGFLMADGKPAYASQYSYDDTSIDKVYLHKDPRLQIFLKRPGQKNVFKNMNATEGDHAVETEPYPNITTRNAEKGYSTGYAIRKGGTFDKALCANGQGYTACIEFRATEALLNYIEAQYMHDGNLNSTSISYWESIRRAAGFTGAAVNPETTIAATDMSKETAGLNSGTAYDWGAFTAGKAVDKTLYSIRRERRCELMAEGLRWMDLIRWRSLDQLKDHPYHIEGIHIWNTPMEEWYTDATTKKSTLVPGDNISEKSRSEYLRPYEIVTNNNSFYNGFTWAMGQYLYPIPVVEFLLTSTDHASVELSPLYQNPYWKTTPDTPAEE